MHFASAFHFKFSLSIFRLVLWAPLFVSPCLLVDFPIAVFVWKLVRSYCQIGQRAIPFSYFVNPFTIGVISVAVPFVLSMVRKYLPPAATPYSGKQYSLPELDVRFRTTKWIVGLSMPLVGIVFAVASYRILLTSNRLLAAADGMPEYMLLPEKAIWWFVPLFGALALMWPITKWLWTTFGDSDEAQLYTYWSSLKSGYDTEKVSRFLNIFLVLPVAIFTVLALSMHISFTGNEIRECGYAFARCKTYPYENARRITAIEGYRSREGKLEHRACIVVDFSDGRRWSSAEIGDAKDSVDPQLKGFLQSKIHLPFNYAQTMADIPPLPPAP
jgi:hypothetical protein